MPHLFKEQEEVPWGHKLKIILFKKDIGELTEAKAGKEPLKRHRREQGETAGATDKVRTERWLPLTRRASLPALRWAWWCPRPCDHLQGHRCSAPDSSIVSSRFTIPGGRSVLPSLGRVPSPPRQERETQASQMFSSCSRKQALPWLSTSALLGLVPCAGERGEKEAQEQE